MKKLISIFAAALFIFTLSSCGGDKEADKTNNEEKVTACKCVSDMEDIMNQMDKVEWDSDGAEDLLKNLEEEAQELSDKCQEAWEKDPEAWEKALEDCE